AARTLAHHPRGCARALCRGRAFARRGAGPRGAEPHENRRARRAFHRLPDGALEDRPHERRAPDPGGGPLGDLDRHLSHAADGAGVEREERAVVPRPGNRTRARHAPGCPDDEALTEEKEDRMETQKIAPETKAVPETMTAAFDDFM